VGLGGVAAGAVFAGQAGDKNTASKSLCSPTNPDFCSAAGKQARSQAIADGNIATVGLIAGPILAATGVALFVAGSVGNRTEHAPSGALSMEAAPMVGAGLFGGVVQGRF
jgi:hypothetical protein